MEYIYIYIHIHIYKYIYKYIYIYIYIYIYVGRTNEGKEVGNAGKSATESRCFRFGCVLCLRGADVPSLSRRFPSKSVISIIPDSGLFVLTERCASYMSKYWSAHVSINGRGSTLLTPEGEGGEIDEL